VSVDINDVGCLVSLVVHHLVLAVSSAFTSVMKKLSMARNGTRDALYALYATRLWKTQQPSYCPMTFSAARAATRSWCQVLEQLVQS
jgi:hypothetical protein